MKKIHLLALVVAVAGSTAAGAREPSEACDTGELTPATTPSGLGVRQAGDPYQDPTSLYLCSRTVAPGAVWVRADTATGRVHVIADGDSTNRLTACSDGYAAARADASGVRVYRADDGDYSFSSGGTGVEAFVTGAAGCLGPRP